MLDYWLLHCWLGQQYFGCVNGCLNGGAVSLKCFGFTQGQGIDDGEDLQLKPDQFVTRSLVILYCKSAGGKSLTKIIPQDAMTVEHHRQLRQRLMLHASLAEGQH